MTNVQSTLVVLIDAEDVKYAFAGWPDDICLATCLTRDGECRLMVFRRDERPGIADRVLDRLGVAEDEVAFVPRVPGFATRPFLYSDERRLMALVSSDPDILDEAIDYAVNYTYALEEGLDPAMVLGLEPTSVQLPHRPVPAPTLDPEPSEPAKPRELSPLLPDFLRKSAEQSRRPRFASVRTSKLGLLAS